ncbi:type I restriction enzyme S subunit [Rhodopirellula rubra]|uniref:Type I restriction enzyme S subunit n=1 Tax=Aporhodopirellula rubra TaxID=980271 RepID=A0A7W5DU71_9BACT|nr:restriction endonuclease subunit S [Aporhodopirellula rubra]MBB3204244.1 type I restriction enzyme S subunit [Aporhodopirellula rubra]
MKNARTANTKTGGRSATDRVIMGEYALAVGLPEAEAPTGWKWTKLTDVSRLESGHTPSRRFPEYWGGTVPWLGIKDAREYHGETIHQTREYTNPLGLKNSSARLLPAKTVCLSRTASVGYVVVMGEEMATSQDFVNWVCSDDLYPQFLKYLLVAEKKAYSKFSSGAVHQTIYFPEAKAFHICHPSVAEQKRIVSILDEAFGAIERAKENAERNLANAKELFASYLDRVFAQKGDGWEEKTVGEIAIHSLGKMLDKRKNRGTPSPYLRNKNVRWFDFDLDDLLEMKFESQEKHKYTAESGDVLVCEGGYPGRAAIWNSTDPIFFQKAIHRIRFNDAAHNRWFVYFIFHSDVRGTLRQYFTGAGIQHFTGKALGRFKIPVPPDSALVETFCDRFDSLREKTEKMETLYTQKLTALDELKQSILQKAFTGQLTAKSAELELVG